MPVTVAIDVMGGDFGPRVTVSAALDFLERHADATAVLVGRQSEIENELTRLGRSRSPFGARFDVRHAAEVVAMDDPPVQAMRRKRESSMHLAIGLVKDGRADAAISAGNTGAWMAISSMLLRTLEGVDRPALCSLLPNQK